MIALETEDINKSKNLIPEKITSLDLYLKFPPEQIIETACLEDVGAGVYPCYYRRCGDKLKVSTSAVSLVIDSGTFQPNPHFRPPDFLSKRSQETSFLFRIARKLNKHLNTPKFKEVNSWYAEWETIDKRIKKLKAFESVTFAGSGISFKPNYTLRDNTMIVDKSSRYITQFIHSVEKAFPDYDHVVLLSGKDSQLICLTPKLNEKNWHIFSAEPNYPLIIQWLKQNGIHANKIFRHDNHNEETIEDQKKKIICGDLYSDPRHIRWMPAMANISREFNGRCMFWGGTMSTPAHVYAGPYIADLSDFKSTFFKYHFERTASWQGNYHQVFKNFTGLPYLSPYHSREIWEEVYQHLDPRAISKNTDLREAIGEKLFGKPVKWINENPGPLIYEYDFYINSYKTYVQHIQKMLSHRKGAGESMEAQVKIYEPDKSIKKGYGSVFKEIIDEIADNRWLTYQLFIRDFTALYKQSFMGFVWIFLIPLFSVSTFMILNRSGVFHIGDVGVPYALYAVLGLAFWQFFSSGLIAATSCLVEAGPMIKIINFSKKSLVFAATGRAMVSFFIQFYLVTVLLVWFRFLPHAEAFWAPFLILPLVLLTWGLGFALSLLNSVMRDIGNALSMLMTFFMFLTPVLYPKPESGLLRTISEKNPIYYLIDGPRDLILYGRIEEVHGFLYSCLFSVVVFIACLVIFHMTETRITERI